MSKAALITGSAKRIGRQTALELASQGFDIAISYNQSKQQAKELAQEIQRNYNQNCQIFQADLTDHQQSERLIKETLESFPNLNLLINNASTFKKSKFLNDESQLLDNLNLHLISPLKLSRIFAQNIINNDIKNAQIINFTDKNVTRYETSYFHYLLSKKFLNEATKMLSIELAPHIRVNSIAPGFILSDHYLEQDLEKANKIINKIPLQHKGEISNILQGINFLLENNFITGQTLFIDGGASLNHAG